MGLGNCRSFPTLRVPGSGDHIMGLAWPGRPPGRPPTTASSPEARCSHRGVEEDVSPSGLLQAPQGRL